MATATQNKTMELEGNLKAFQLPDILRFLAMGKMTGILTIAGQQRTVELTINSGLLIGTGSPERFLRLGQLLVYSGLISRKSLDEVLESQRDNDAEVMLGEILIERRLVSSVQVEQALTLQMKEELWELFSWAEGSFKFEQNKTLNTKRSLVSLEIEPLIEEGLEQMEQWRVIASNLGDPNQIFRVRPDLAGPPEAKFSPNTWRVLSLVNGRHSIQMLIYLSGLGKFETLCALDRLLGLQIIEPIAAKPKFVNNGGKGKLKITSAPTRPANGNAAASAGASDGQGGGGLRGLLGMRRRQASVLPNENGAHADSGTSAAHAGPCLTAVSLACSLINRVILKLCQEPEFKPEGSAETLSESLWREVGMRFPRADLIELRQGQFDPFRYERYVEMAGGVDQYLAGCHEDSMEALAEVGQLLVRRASQRLGERASRLIAETVRPYLENVEVAYPSDFMPHSWADQWMRAAG